MAVLFLLNNKGDSMKRLFRLSLLLLIVALAGCFCDDDPTTPPATTGDVLISIIPDTLTAGWSLQGPGDYRAQGLGNLALNSLDPGTYTLAWGTLENWDRPEPAEETLVLEAGEQITFTGLYTGVPATLDISHNLPWEGIAWELDGPDGYQQSGLDAALITDLVPGQYTLGWTDSDLCTAPADTTFALAPGEAGTMVGLFDCGYTAFNPDLLVMGFGDAYEGMLTEDLSAMLAEDFQFIILPATLEEWANAGNPLGSSSFDRTTFAAIHANLFGGESGLGPAGNLVPSVAGIEVAYLEKQGAWSSILLDDDHFGGTDGYRALYSVLLFFNTPDQFRFQVNHDVEFYVVAEEVAGVEIWKLLGMVGHQPYGAVYPATETTTWDMVLSLYR